MRLSECLSQAPYPEANAALFGAGRPMLLLPGARHVGKLDHVVITWDRSRVGALASLTRGRSWNAAPR